MDFAADFDAAQTSISQALVNTIRSATRTSAEDVSFYRSLDSTLGRALDRQNARLLALTERLVRRTSTTPQASSLSLPSSEAIDSKWKALVDVTDTLLERADICLDEYTGLIKRSSPQNAPSSPSPSQHPAQKSKSFRAQNIPKPQLEFQVKPSNNEERPFRPFLSAKPHATVPLDQSITIAPNEFGNPQFQHPYAPEIEQYDYPPFVGTQAEPIPYSDLKTTTAEFVDTIDGVHRMLDELKTASVIAIDLEHHDAHSYIGLVSLMQISTRDHDWIVDTLKPWRRELEVLNEVFADPNILKVLHGAQMDIVWLQRDLGLYIVGLFDTHHASRVLGYAGGSLAFLLKKFIDFDAQKQYQTADWRLRPLPKEMFNYARSDTHFLLYIYDNIRNELIQKSNFDNPEENKLLHVLQKSKETALQRYEYDVYDQDRGLGRGGWYSLLRKSSALLSKQQFAVFLKVHQWRDEIARREDEGTFQIMPSYALFNVARLVPPDTPSLLNCLHPVSQPVRARASELLSIIKQAGTESVNGPEMSDVLSQVEKEIGDHWRSTHKPAKAENPPVETGDTADTAPTTGSIRTQASQFWGPTLFLQNDTLPTWLSSNLTFDITPELPPVDAAAFIETTAPDSSLQSPAASSPTTPNTSSHLGKRKAASLNGEDDPTSSQEPSAAPTPTSTEPQQPKFIEKLQRRAERKAAKARARVGSSNGTENSAPVVDTQPFDYASAPSILNANPENGNGISSGTNERKKGGKNKQKPFDLYGRASDAKGGLGKSGVHGSGKSGTFR